MRMWLGLGLLVVAVVASGCFSKPPAPGTADDGGVGAQDSAGDGPPADAFVSTNYMFVTSGSWTGVELADLAIADGHCAAAAAAGSLPGTFVAWVSTGSVHAKDRLAGARGWVRPDHEPFADQVSDIVTGTLFYPPLVNELGAEQSGSLDVYTGTGKAGTRVSNCPGNTSATVGASDATTDQWTEQLGLSPCGNVFHLYCFGIDNNFPVKPPPAPSGARRAFVTASSVAIDVGGAAGFNQVCMAEAAANSLTGTFVALVATVGSGARARLSENPGGWYRVDDVKIANDDNFTALRAPLNVTAGKSYATGKVWTGIPSTNPTFDTAATTGSSCNNWVDPVFVNVGAVGDIERSNKQALSSDLVACDAATRVYCFQN